MQITAQPLANSDSTETLTKVIYNLAYRLIEQAGQRISERLTAYMSLPHQLNALNADMIAAGQVDLHDPIAREQHLWRLAKAFPSLSYIGFALTDGSRESGAGRWINRAELSVYENWDYKGCDYATDEYGNRTHLIQSYDYDALSQPWHKQALAAGKPIWTDIFTADIEDVEVSEQKSLSADDSTSDDSTSNVGYENYVAVNAERPLYDQNGDLFGLAIVDVLLTEISQFLIDLKVSPGGQVFIMERDGTLVGSADPQSFLHRVDGKLERFSALNTPNVILRSIAEALQSRFTSFQTIHTHQQFDVDCNGDRQFVDVTPWQESHGLDWLVVVSIPESDLIRNDFLVALPK
jgi:hypothetical protein